MFRFEKIEYLMLLALVLVVAVLFVFYLNWRKRKLKLFGSRSIINRLFENVSIYKVYAKFLLVSLALLALIICVANPQAGARLEEVKAEGIDVIIALDVSNSMKAEDLKPNRLENAKMTIDRLIDKMKDDRVGIIVFGGEAYVQLPVTTDYTAAKLFLNTINTDIVPTQGTNIGAAIELARKSFDPKSAGNKAVIIITDGENHEEDALSQAKEALKEGIHIYAIGMGSPEGAPIPVYSNGRHVGFKQDQDGNTVVTKLNETALAEIVEAGGGYYARATDSQRELAAVFNEIGKLEKTNYGTKVYTDYEDYFQYFAALAFILLIVDSFISNKRSKLWTRINLFGAGRGTNV